MLLSFAASAAQESAATAPAPAQKQELPESPVDGVRKQPAHGRKLGTPTERRRPRKKARKNAPPTESGIFMVTYVVDGDTLKLSNEERVRLIGVDTPETRHPRKKVEFFGKEASAFTRAQIEGRQVRLEYDHNYRDRYGRILAYVYRLPDNFFLNAEIVKQGYGFAYTKFPFDYLEEFRAYEREARENERGLWAPHADRPAAASPSKKRK